MWCYRVTYDLYLVGTFTRSLVRNTSKSFSQARLLSQSTNLSPYVHIIIIIMILIVIIITIIIVGEL